MCGRVSVQVTCSPRDQRHFAEYHFAVTDEGFSNGWAQLASQGVVFYAAHGAGNELGAMLFASDGELSQWAHAGPNGYPSIEMHPDGEMDQDDLEAARSYWGVRKAAEAKMKLTHQASQTSGE